MTASARIIVLSVVFTTIALLLVGAQVLEIEPEPGNIIFDWTVVNNIFHLEVKNATKKVFILDEFFVEGFNIVIIGLNLKFKKVYTTNFGIDIKRLPPTLIRINPGNYHRTAFEINKDLDDLLQRSKDIEVKARISMPESAKYVKLRWAKNPMGAKLPDAGLETSLYELKRRSDKQDAGKNK